MNGRLISGFFLFAKEKRWTDGRVFAAAAAMSDVFYQWAGGDRVTKKKKRHFYLIFVFVSYSYLGVGEAEEIRKRFLFFFSFVWRFHRLQQTHINPSRSNPFSVYVTCNAALEAAVCVCTL